MINKFNIMSNYDNHFDIPLIYILLSLIKSLASLEKKIFKYQIFDLKMGNVTYIYIKQKKNQ
jgi:hypothetical protein